jgi:hypothetical protein
MNVVRNIVMVVVTGTVVAAGLFSVIVVPPGSTIGGVSSPVGPPPAPPFPGAQLAFGSANSVTPPTGTTTPTIPSDVVGGVQGFVTGLPADYAANYASQSAALLQSFIDSQRKTAGVPALAYDSNLGTVAAALIADTIASGQPFPGQGGVNSLGQTPIQQVMVQFPNSKATYVSTFVVISDVNNANDATNPQAGISSAENDLLVDTNKTMLNAGWTHYGFAVETIPAVPNVSNARRYYVIFFAKES